MTNQVLETIKRRRSVRAFLPQRVESEKLEAIVEAGQYAPNGGGEAWHFTLIQNPEVLERLNLLAKEYAQGCGLPWLEELGRDEAFHSLYHAPALVLVAGDEQGVCAEADTAAATQTLLLAAESLGVASCWGYFATQAFLSQAGQALRAELKIPEGYRVYTSVMLGYASGEIPPAPARQPGRVTCID